MSLQKWQQCCEDIAKYVNNAGKASYGTVQGGMVNVNGKLYPYKTAVPMTVIEGSKVYVHITDNTAVVIGG